jgi:hypothetical protein
MVGVGVLGSGAGCVASAGGCAMWADPATVSAQQATCRPAAAVQRGYREWASTRPAATHHASPWRLGAG